MPEKLFFRLSRDAMHTLAQGEKLTSAISEAPGRMASPRQQDTTTIIRVGIVGISEFGGGEAIRLVASHYTFELTYAAGEGSAGSRLVDRFPGVPAKLAELVIAKWDPAALPKLDMLFAPLPTGASAEALARVPRSQVLVGLGVAEPAVGAARPAPGMPVLASMTMMPGSISLSASSGADAVSVAAGKQQGLAARLCPSIWAGRTSARLYAQPSA